MDLDLSDDQKLFLDTTHKFLAQRWPTSTLRTYAEDSPGYDRSLWTQGAELGWTALLVPEDFGGGTISGHGVRDLGIVAEELGHRLFVGPVIATNVAADALARGGATDLAAEHLPRIAAGEEIVAWALAEDNDTWSAETGAVTAEPTDGGVRLSGVKTPVQDAHLADQLLVTVRDGERVAQMLVPTDAPGLTVEILDGLDLGRRYARIEFDGVEVPSAAILDADERALDRQLALSLALQCAETVGAADEALTMTLAYVKERKAFGRAIGSYQALKHRLAEALFYVESAKAATSAAIAAVDTDRDALVAARKAKVYVAKRLPFVVRDCLQMHGGIGFTWEHDIHLYLRRVDSNAAIDGGADYHLDRLAPTIGF